MKLKYFFPGLIFIASSCSVFIPTSRRLFNESVLKSSQVDAIIVPGFPFNEPEWDRVMLMRVTWAVHLYNKGFTKNIIMSGSAVYSPYVESEIMKLYAVALGVPAENVFIEKEAEHSVENVWNSYRMGKQMGFNDIALASDPFQTRMLYRFCKKRLKKITFLPVIFDTLKTLPHITPKIDYSNLKIENFESLTAKQNWWTRLRGTRGKNIDFKK